jgi:esterase
MLNVSNDPNALLNYRIFGELSPNTPPLIVLHGLLGSLENWYTFARSQADKRAVIALDLRNHGGSPHVTGMTYREMADDVLAVIDALNIQQCYLMGHSMGGKVAMTLALLHPAMVERLIVVDIAPKAYTPRHQALIQAMVAMPLAELQNRKQADEWLSTTVKQPFERGFLLKNLGRNSDGTFYWQCYLQEIARQYLKITSFPVLATTFNAPSLFIRGGQSDYVQDTDLSSIQQYFPQAVLQTVATAGHLPHVQTPAEFIALVETFLA